MTDQHDPTPLVGGARASADDGPVDADVVDDELVDAALAASRALLGAVARSLAGALEEVTPPQFRVLVLLATRGPQRSGALAAAIGVHPSTFTRSADRLVAGGWVRRNYNPDSRREVVVELTDRGRALVEDVSHRRRVEMTAVLARLEPDRQALVLAGLDTYATAAGEVSASDLWALGG